MKSLWERLPVEQRAGTRIDHSNMKHIFARGKAHGLLDMTNKVYQTGGELNNFTFRMRGWLTISATVWDQIRDQADTVEIIDHPTNKCYSISTAEMAKHGEQYDAGIGPRIGVPKSYWNVTDGHD